VRWEFGLYALGLVVAIGGLTSTWATGWYALFAVAAGLAIFATGVVVEERRYTVPGD
jgi:hypothetical protein